MLDPEGRPLAGVSFRGMAPNWGYAKLGSERFTVEPYWPDQPRLLQFVHKERKLAAGHILQGPQQEPLAVTLRPWGVITGRVLDAEGRPQAGALLTESRRGTEDPAAGMPPERYYFADENGRFRIEGLAVGVKYNLLVKDEPTGRTRGQVIFDATVEAGETKDLGDLKVKPITPPSGTSRPVGLDRGDVQVAPTLATIGMIISLPSRTT